MTAEQSLSFIRRMITKKISSQRLLNYTDSDIAYIDNIIEEQTVALISNHMRTINLSKENVFVLQKNFVNEFISTFSLLCFPDNSLFEPMENLMKDLEKATDKENAREIIDSQNSIISSQIRKVSENTKNASFIEEFVINFIILNIKSWQIRQED